MTKHQDILLNKARLSAACRQLSMTQLMRVKNNVESFITEKEQQIIQAEEQKKRLQEKKQRVMAALKEEGLTLNDLIENTYKSSTSSSSKPVLMQYRIQDTTGQMHEWSGRGRTPKIFADFFANGGSKEACKIN